MAGMLDLDKLAGSNSSGGVVYPFIQLPEANECIPTILISIPEGDLPIVVALDGKSTCVRRIDPSALNIAQLLRVSETLIYHVTAETYHVLTTAKDYLEVL